MDKKSVVNIHAMEYYSGIRKKEILSFATMWMNTEGIVLSKISQRKTNAAYPPLYMESKIVHWTEAESRMVVSRS